MKQDSKGWLVMTLLFVVCISFSANAYNEVNGTVVTVIDGNTLEVAGDDQETHKVMLIGIDCPELGQEFGASAKKYLEKKILNKKVKVVFQGKDRWGNRLAIVTTHNDDDLRVELLKEGLAWTAEKNPDTALESHRVKAQEKKKGLWKEDNPTPPWTYRRQQTMLQPKSS